MSQQSDAPPPQYQPYEQYPAHPGPYGQYVQQPYLAPRPTNTMAVLSLVFAFVLAPLGVVFGHIARGQIRRTGEGGAGLALAGLIISYVSVGFFVLYVLFIIFVFAMGAPSN